MAVDIDALKAELLAGHPGTGAYSSDDAVATAELLTVNRSRNLSSLTGSEVVNAINVTEFDALSAVDKQMVWDIVHLGDVNPFGVEATLFTNIFGGGSTTITALAAARTEAVSRAEELGFGSVGVGHVQEARRL